MFFSYFCLTTPRSIEQTRLTRQKWLNNHRLSQLRWVYTTTEAENVSHRDIQSLRCEKRLSFWKIKPFKKQSDKDTQIVKRCHQLSQQLSRANNEKGGWERAWRSRSQVIGSRERSARNFVANESINFYSFSRMSSKLFRNYFDQVRELRFLIQLPQREEHST